MKFRLLNLVVTRTCNYVSTRHFARTSVTFNKTDEIPENWKEELHSSMQIYPDFISPEEEESLVKEIEPRLKRLRYEELHWDDAIHSYRETERAQWNEANTEVLRRVKEKAFPKNLTLLPVVHVLDLAEKGWIKPHVDSVKFCGGIIAGLSLLSDSVMRLTLVGKEKECVEDFLLPRRSLYIMSGTARYDYNHEILKSEDSYYRGQHVPKTRRISVICRCEPSDSNK